MSGKQSKQGGVFTICTFLSKMPDIFNHTYYQKKIALIAKENLIVSEILKDIVCYAAKTDQPGVESQIALCPH